MEKLFVFFFLMCTLSAEAQITIVKADMPVAGDTIRFSNASLQTPVDLTLTGANYNWDFSTLLPVSQGLDTFLTVLSTPLIYSVFFNPFGSNPANIAQKGSDITGVPTVTVTDLYNFFDKTNSTYEQVGIGATINGVTTPVTYGSHDIVYRFPMNFGNADSSDSDYALSLPTLGSYNQQTHRVNHVDGWGTLITPFGTYDVLRVVTDLTGYDSIYVTSLATSFTNVRPLTREYKWWGSGFEIPLLQINTTVTGPFETVTAIIYRDNFVTNVGIDQEAASSGSIQLFPNPSSGNSILEFESKSNEEVHLQILDVSGKIVMEKNYSVSIGKNRLCMVEIPVGGVYLLKSKQGTEVCVKRLVIER